MFQNFSWPKSYWFKKICAESCQKFFIDTPVFICLLICWVFLLHVSQVLQKIATALPSFPSGDFSLKFFLRCIPGFCQFFFFSLWCYKSLKWILLDLWPVLFQIVFVHLLLMHFIFLYFIFWFTIFFCQRLVNSLINSG